MGLEIMKVLIVASFNKGRFAPFITEQVEVLKQLGCEVDYFGLQGRGIKGYVQNLPSLRQRIKAFQPDVIHAHYGLSGLFANLQRSVRVVTTYHGSDVNDNKAFQFSKMAMKLSAWNIFVSRKTLEIAKSKTHLLSLRGGTTKQSRQGSWKKYTLLPCGIDLSELQLTEKAEARQRMKFSHDKKIVLFAGAFDNAVKNVGLAKEAVTLLDEDVELLELKGYSRDEVTLMMCAADVFLMTSFSEGSPQVIKEAMACGCPIVSVDVGDVKERMEGVEGCYVSETRSPQALAELLHKAMSFQGKTQGRRRVMSDGLENKMVAQQLMGIYERVVRDENN